MADCCLGPQFTRDAIAKSTGAMPLNKEFDGSNVNDKKFEGTPTNVSTK
jgi:hypothetical protein